MEPPGRFLDPVSPDDVLSSAGGNWFAPPTYLVQLGFAYGVGGTSLTGTYNPAPPTLNTIQTITNNGDGTYSVRFNQTISLISSGAEASVIAIPPTGGLLYTVTNAALDDANTVRWTLAGAPNFQLAFWLDGVPQTISCANGFAISPYASSP